jgi:PIN domain nuclease of toxin-antitoxin system
MRILLDTHIFLWYISDDPRLSPRVKDAIELAANQVFFSAVSLWEAMIKYRLGRLPLPAPPEEYLPAQRERHQIETLVLDEASVSVLAQLPLHHRDPFDRMIICQALANDMIVATVDPAFQAYPVRLFH